MTNFKYEASNLFVTSSIKQKWEKKWQTLPSSITVWTDMQFCPQTQYLNSFKLLLISQTTSSRTCASGGRYKQRLIIHNIDFLFK